MATTSRSGAGGKIIKHRRKQRLAATPYDRMPLQKSPNWFAGVVFPSARAIASGAGKIFSSIFSDSGSSSSEDEAYASEDDIVNDNLAEIPYNLENTLNEKNGTQYWRNETKKIIEQLIMKETFSREECDRLTKVINSRIIDWSMEAEENSVASSPENVDIFDKAVQEAKRWFHKKKVGLCSVTELAQETSNLEHVGDSSPSPSSYCYCVVIIEWRTIVFGTICTNGYIFLTVWSVLVAYFFISKVVTLLGSVCPFRYPLYASQYFVVFCNSVLYNVYILIE